MRHRVEDFPFRIRDVQELMGLQPVRSHAEDSDFNCIFCGGKGKMNINYRKNVYGCVKCGAGGGMLGLYASYYNLTAREAYDEICEKLILKEPAKAAEFIAWEDMEKAVPESIRASEDEIHHTYSMLLSHLTLSKKHLEDLTRRGLTEEQIRHEEYRSTPVFGLKKLTETLLEEGVPGFYQDKNGQWTLNFHNRNSGFLIPVRTIDGKIQGMQIRADEVIEDRKYVWFSSGGRNMGTSSGSPVHIIGDTDADEVYVTEGPLKGTIAHYMTGKTFLCVAGVTQYRKMPEILKALKQRKLARVSEAYDMDKLIHCGVRPAKCPTCVFRGTCEPYGGFCSLDDSLRRQVAEIHCPHLQVKRDNIQRGCMHPGVWTIKASGMARTRELMIIMWL